MRGPNCIDTVFREGEGESGPGSTGAGSGTAAWTLTESDGRRAISGPVTLGLAINIGCAVQPGHAGVYRIDFPNQLILLTI